MDWVAIIVTVVTIMFLTVLVIKRFVYFRPTRFVGKSQYTDIYEGNLHGWFCGSGTNPTILFCHGNLGNVSHRIPKIESMVASGFDVLIFDYSGYGKSSGVPNEGLCYANADVFMNYLAQKGVKQIIPYGEGMGAAVALHTAIRHGLSRVILDSPWLSVKDAIPGLKLFPMIFTEFNSQNLSKVYKGEIWCLGPCLIGHKTFDNFSQMKTSL